MQNFFLIFTTRCAIIKKLIRRCDGIGRRDGLKIRWWRHRVGSSPTTGTNKKGNRVSGSFLFIWNAWVGLEGRAAQSNSPVDCCDRERPSARRRANRVPPPAPEKSTSSEVLFSTKFTLRVGEILLCNVKFAWQRVKSLRRRVDFISLSAEQKISRPRSGYFTFCTRKIYHSSLNFESRQRFLFLFGTHEWGSKDERHRATVRCDFGGRTLFSPTVV